VSADSVLVDRRGSQSRVIGFLISATMAVVAMSLALAIGEAATRYKFRNVRSTASGGGYFNRQQPALRANSLGYRDREFVVPKPAGTYRVAVIGDSITFGGGLDEEDRFTSLIQDRVGRDGIEILNLGVPGRDLPQHLDALEHDALPLDPDFILLQLFVNDFDSPDEGHPTNPHWSEGFHRWLEKRSALYTVASIELGTIKGELGIVETYPEYMQRTLGDQATPASIGAAKRLRAFIRMCRDAHRPLGIVFFPHLAFDLKRNYPFAYLNDRVERICREEGVPYLDLRPEFGAATRDTLQVNRFDAHPSPKASRIAAAAILTTFGPTWYEGRARR
jgi:lysophospholipase L1-like esterase